MCFHSNNVRKWAFVKELCSVCSVFMLKCTRIRYSEMYPNFIFHLLVFLNLAKLFHGVSVFIICSTAHLVVYVTKPHLMVGVQTDLYLGCMQLASS